MLRKQLLQKLSPDAPTPKSLPRARTGPPLYIARLEERIRKQEERIRKLETLVESMLTKIKS